MVFRIKLALFYLVLLASFNGYAQTATFENSYTIEKNKLTKHRESGIDVRTIYIKLESHSFERTKSLRFLSQIFRSIQAQNCYPERLTIYAFDDLEQLNRQISYDDRMVFIDFPNTPEGRSSSSKYYKSIGPKLSGYFRAFYNRNLAFEVLGFSPNIDEANIEQVWLNKPENASFTIGSPALCGYDKPSK